MNARFAVAAGIILLVLSCCATPVSCSSTARNRENGESTEQAHTETTVRGKACNDEVLGACVSTAEGLAIYIQGVPAWSAEISGQEVVATGILSRQSHDTLVPVDKPLEAILRGEPATDTHVTAGFLVLEDAKWELAPEDK